MSDPETNVAVPDYTSECCVCGATPTVLIETKEGKPVHHTEMCGVCTWGSAAFLDPSDW